MTNDTIRPRHRAPRGLEGLRITRRGRIVRTAALLLAAVGLELALGCALAGRAPLELLALLAHDAHALAAGYVRLAAELAAGYAHLPAELAGGAR